MIMTENRLTAMKGTQTLYLLFISGFCSFALGYSEFHLISVSKTYTQAKTYCREMYSDLATVHNSTEMDTLVTLVPSSVARAWIGLEAGDVRRWHWSQPGQQVDFLNWKEGEPQNTNEDTCVVMDQHGKWFESQCGTIRKFVCHDKSAPGALTFVADTKSWRDAQKHCRDLSFDLISIHSAEENEVVRILTSSQNVWIGLFKDPWKWSDGSDSSFRYWKPNQPNYLEGQDCAAAIFKDEGKWNDRRCSDKRRFICQGAKKSVPTTTITPTSTQQTLTPDQSTVNLTTHPIISQATSTLHFTVATNQSHTTVTTEEATTKELTTPNATALPSTMSSTDLNTATTQMSTLTSTQQLPTTTTQATTQGVSTLTTPKATSALTITQSSAPKPTKTEGVLPGNLILIQENMTWSEAVRYCKEHHIDLVHIPTEDIQGKVAETAKNATTAHAWLGLQYTCKFNFWFWTKSTPGCYQNWAPGQGNERKYDCGVTGAIESTGGQQWVGLPGTERLNFICSTCTG